VRTNLKTLAAGSRQRFAQGGRCNDGALAAAAVAGHVAVRLQADRAALLLGLERAEEVIQSLGHRIACSDAV